MSKNRDFIAYMSALVQQLEQDGRYGTAHVYRYALRRCIAHYDTPSLF